MVHLYIFALVRSTAFSFKDLERVRHTDEGDRPRLLLLKATLAFNALLLTVWITFLMLGSAYLDAQNNAEGLPNVALTRAGGALGIVAAFLAWYNMFAGMADPSNSFFLVPVVHCKLFSRHIKVYSRLMRRSVPWSEKGREMRKKNPSDDTLV